MVDGLETELKLAASAAMLLHLQGHPLLTGEDHPLTLVTRYFDTAEDHLHRAGASLRLREGGAQGEQTFKSSPNGRGAVRRGEWTTPATGAEPDPAAFPPQPRRQIEAMLDGGKLQPLAISRIERTTRRLRYGGAAIEAAFDFGTIDAGARSEPVAELELELVKGSPAELFALARQLPLGPDLLWSVESKAERGHALARDMRFAAVRAGEVALDPAMDVVAGFQSIAWSCLGQLLGNYREVIATGDPDAVHQSRVAIRRLRAAFSLFGDAIADEQSETMRAEWKAAGAGLGPARDLHVLIERIEAAATASGSDAGELIDSLRSKRASATREAQAMLAGKPFQHLLLHFAEWLERLPSRSGEALPDFAARTLGRRRRKLVKGRPLEERSEHALHDLRIAGKKLRYAAEFFAALYRDGESARARRDFVKALGKLQDCLGSVHDLAVAQEQRDSLFADLEPITGARHSARLAELLGSHGPSRKQLVRSAAKALDRVADAPAWWKLQAPPQVGND